MVEKKFCTQCGAVVPDDAQFCPACGQAIAGNEAEAGLAGNIEQYREMMMDNSTAWTALIITMYAIPAIIFAISGLIQAGSLAATIAHSADFQEYMRQLGWIISEQDILNYLNGFAYTMLASGICAAISAFFVKKRVKWILAVVFCLLASVLCIWSVFGFFIGLLVSLSVIRLKPCFID